MAPSEAALSMLQKASEKLNSESDSLNGVFSGLNSRLGAMRIGVSLWLDVELDLHESLCSSESGSYYSASAWTIGYDKVDDEWCLAAKRRSGVTVTSEEPTNDEFRWSDFGSPVSLLKAPRIVRVEAAGLLDALIAALGKQIEQYLQSIEKAKKLVEAK
jgi:hypothetical protein